MKISRYNISFCYKIMFYQEGLNYTYVSFKFYLRLTAPLTPAPLLWTIRVFDVLTLRVINRVLSFAQLVF